MALLKRLIVLMLALYMAALLVLYVAQRSLVFAPDPQRVVPDATAQPGVREIALQTAAGGELYSWYAPLPNRPVILFAHGNAGNVSTRAKKISRLNTAGFGVLVIGYPGYGGSAGAPSETGMVQAAQRAYDFLHSERFDSSQIVIYGESLGTAVAVQLAAENPAAALILEAPMSSALAMAVEQYPFFPLRWLMRDPFLSTDHIERVSQPLLVIHGDQDQAIPISSGKALFAAAAQPKQLHVVAGGGHSDLYDFDLVAVLQAFTATYLSPSP